MGEKKAEGEETWRRGEFQDENGRQHKTGERQVYDQSIIMKESFVM